jgi:hypothetical protein
VILICKTPVTGIQGKPLKRIVNIYNCERISLTISNSQYRLLAITNAQPEQTNMASRITPKLNRFQITTDVLPGVIFFSLADLRDGCQDALAERRAIDEYRIDGVEEALFDTLRGLGWEYSDIAAVARGSQMVTSYGMPTA